MKGLGKVHPPDTKVLEDIWLSFYFGAKIGVLGLNGAGKSSLLKIMAGEDRASSAKRFPATASRSASCTRSRGSIRRRTSSATSRKASPTTKALLARYDEVNAKLGEDLSPDEMEKVLDEQSKIQDKIDAVERVGPRLAARAGDGRAAAAAARRRRRDALRRRAPARRAVPAAAAVARSAAARRADQPSRRRVGRLARALPQGLRRHGRRRDARSLLPRQRRRLDSRARSRPRHPLGRQLLVVARAEAEPPAAGREGRDRASSGPSSASSNGSACRRARARPRARRA